MSYLLKRLRGELEDLAKDLGIAVAPAMNKKDIVKNILEDKEYDEENVRAMLEAVQLERAEKQKQFELDRAEEQKQLELEERERQRQRNFELEKLRIEEAERNQAFELERLRLTNTVSNNNQETSQNGGGKTARDLHHLMPKYEPDKSDIALYLILFERQARRAKIEEQDFVHHLTALLPPDIVEVFVREPEEKWQDYSYIKGLLLQRFRLNPEAFRVKFVLHQRRLGSLWKDYSYELKNYLEEWIKGLEVTTFESLQDLMLTDQLKRRATPEIRAHFVDDWGKFVSSEELVKKFDAYETVRRVPKKPPSVGNFQKTSLEPPKSIPYKRGNFKPWADRQGPESSKKNSFNKSDEEGKRTKLFEKRRSPRCYYCDSADHLRPQCPELLKQKAAAPAQNLNNLSSLEKPEDLLAPFMSTAQICGKPMAVLRDTGATIDVISRNHIDSSAFLKETVWVRQPLDLHATCLPLARIEIQRDGFECIITKAAVVNAELDKGYYLLGNRTAELLKKTIKKPHNLASIITRSQSKKIAIMETKNDEPVLKGESEERNDRTPCIISVRSGKGEDEGGSKILPPVQAEACDLLKMTKGDIISAQGECQSLSEIMGAVEMGPDQMKGEYVKEDGILFRISEGQAGKSRKQLVLPEGLRRKVMELCHENVSGHLGVTKTKDRLLRYFFWPGCFKEIETYVRSCDPCQKVGKVGGKRKAPLKIVPVITEIFSKLNVDACGPLPVTSNGNKYLITVICMSSKYPDAIPVPNINSVTVTDALLQIFSRMGFPKVIQCDQGTSFTSNLTTEFFERFGIKVTHSSVYHPQSNPVERFHRTLKRLLRVLCLESGADWERHLPAALFALRTITHESVGFSPAELVHGKNLRTPETLLYEHWVEPDEENQPVTEYVFNLINRMKRCQELMVERLEGLQEKRKAWYDKRAVKRQFKKGDQVLVLAMSRPHKLAVQWHGPGIVESQLSETNYIINLGGKGNHIYHINMLKPYYQRAEDVNLLTESDPEDTSLERAIDFPNIRNDPNIFDFEDITRESGLHERLSPEQIKQIERALIKHLKVF